MRTIMTITALAALLGLTACDNGNAGQNAQMNVAATKSDDANDSMTAGTDTTGDESLQPPDYVTLYKGATVISRKRESGSPNRPGGTIVFTTPDSVEAVINFYNAQSTGVNGMHLNMNKQTNDGRVYIASDRKREVIVDAKRDGNGSKVKLSWYTQKN